MTRWQERRRLSAEEWQLHVQAMKESGLSRAAYCRKHGLSYDAFTYWCHKLSDVTLPHAALVQVPVQAMLEERGRAQNSGVKIVVGDGRLAIEASEQFSAETLGRVLSVLEGR